MIRGWLETTQDIEIPLGVDSKDAFRRAERARALLSVRSFSPDDPELGDDKAAVFHCLCHILSEESSGSPSNLLQCASAAYDLISRASWRDEFGEREEMLCRCAFLAWRGARAGTSAAEAQRWLEQFQEARRARSPLRYKAEQFLAMPAAERSEEFKGYHLSDPEVLLSICGMLKDQRDVSPTTVVEEASSIYRWLARGNRDYFFGDELRHFLGETAYLAGGASRQLGRRAQALRWLDRAESGFSRTMSSEVGLANVAYARLALSAEMGRHDDVLDLLPALVARFESLGMRREVAKCRFLEAVALKGLRRVSEALRVLEPMRDSAVVREDRLLHGWILAELGDLNQLGGRLDVAITAYQQALPLLQDRGLTIPLACLRLYIAATFRAESRLTQAVEAFRAAQRDYRELGMSTYVAYVHLLIAETLLAMHRDREAEDEILAALPTIEEQKMVPEGFAAVALLRESVHRQKTDPEALRQLREHLQAKGSEA